MTRLRYVHMACLFATACASEAVKLGPETAPTQAQTTAINSMAHNLTALAQADLGGSDAGGAAILFALSSQSLINYGASARVAEAVGAPFAPAAPTLTLDGDCAVRTDHSITWNHCSQSGAVIDGSITWGPGHEEIDLHWAASSQGLTYQYAMSGAMTISASAIESDLTFTFSADYAGHTSTATVHSEIDVQITQGCITGGTVTVTATNSDGNPRSRAAQVVWTGCNMYRVRNG